MDELGNLCKEISGLFKEKEKGPKKRGGNAPTNVQMSWLAHI